MSNQTFLFFYWRSQPTPTTADVFPLCHGELTIGHGFELRNAFAISVSILRIPYRRFDPDTTSIHTASTRMLPFTIICQYASTSSIDMPLSRLAITSAPISAP